MQENTKKTQAQKFLEGKSGSGELTLVDLYTCSPPWAEVGYAGFQPHARLVLRFKDGSSLWHAGDDSFGPVWSVMCE